MKGKSSSKTEKKKDGFEFKTSDNTAADNADSILEIGATLVKLLDSGERSDLVIYAKDEEQIRCHSLILFARCSRILDEAVAESDSDRRINPIIPWHTIPMPAAKVFLRYVYGGILDCVTDRSVFNTVPSLAKSYQIDSLVMKLSKINPGELEYVDEEEDFLALPIVVIRDVFNVDSLKNEEKLDEDDDGDNSGESVALVTATQKIDMLLKGFDDDEQAENSDDGEVEKGQENKASEKKKLVEDQRDAKSKENFKETYAVEKEMKDQSTPEILADDSDIFDSSVVEKNLEKGVHWTETSRMEDIDFDMDLEPAAGPEDHYGTNRLKSMNFDSDEDLFDESVTEIGEERKIGMSSIKIPNGGDTIPDELPSFDKYNFSSTSDEPFNKSTSQVEKEKGKEIPKQSDELPQQHAKEESFYPAVSIQNEDVWEDFYDQPDIIIDFDDNNQYDKPGNNQSLFSLKNDSPKVCSTPKQARSTSPAVGTPSKIGTSKAGQAKSITPMPDYSKMISPALKRELKKFGLKVVPKTKAVQVLEHIYHETHTNEVSETANESQKGPGTSYLASQNSSMSMESDNDVPEESILHLEGTIFI